MKRKLFGSVCIAAVAAAVLVPPAHAGLATMAGACQLDLAVERVDSERIEWSTPVAGDCVVDWGSTFEGTGRIGGFVTPLSPLLPFTCAQAVGDQGSGWIQVTVDGDTDGFSGLSTELVMGGGVATITFLRVTGTQQVVVAVGNFVQADPTVAQACLVNDTTVEWTGTLVFEDPILE